MIEVKHLTKRYGNHTAVSDLSFTIEKGKIYGFLGPNGAGKSTTMNIMTGCLAASSGEVTVGGHDIFKEAEQAKKMIGYLPELPPLYPDRTPREYLRFVAEAKGVPAKSLADQIEHVMDVTQIQEVADRLIKNLSKGYKQRVGIAQALLGDPEVIILDEPTVGLDPMQIIEIRDLIKELGKNHTVILSSHILSEVQAVCETVMIISKGKLVACDTPENLEKVFAGSDKVNLVTEASASEVQEILQDVSGIREIKVTGTENNRTAVVLHVEKREDDEICRSIFFAFSRVQRAILQMSAVKASLEDIFIELTSGTQPPKGGKES
ncbi:MAG: ABC transporter ATP-binding protein [Oscillospiraceae bacterium]|nr:ABC transporter ATP-binding protein [Oscillospiraceae bacterium]